MANITAYGKYQSISLEGEAAYEENLTRGWLDGPAKQLHFSRMASKRRLKRNWIDVSRLSATWIAVSICRRAGRGASYHELASICDNDPGQSQR